MNLTPDARIGVVFFCDLKFTMRREIFRNLNLNSQKRSQYIVLKIVFSSVVLKNTVRYISNEPMIYLLQ